MRIRTIKPEFWANEHIARLPDFTILLAIGLLNYADDEGYFNANPALIRAALFPLREDYGSIPVAVTELSNQGFVELFSAPDGRTYGRVVNFLKHQVINKPNKSKIKELCVSPVGLLHLSGSDTVVLPVGTGIREQGSGNGTGREKEVAGAPGLVANGSAKAQPMAKTSERQRDLLFDALAEACGSVLTEMTKRAKSACGVALAEIRAASPDVTPDEIRRRAANYRAQFKGAALTPSALANHWGSMGSPGLFHTESSPARIPENLRPGYVREQEAQA